MGRFTNEIEAFNPDYCSTADCSMNSSMNSDAEFADRELPALPMAPSMDDSFEIEKLVELPPVELMDYLNKRFAHLMTAAVNDEDAVSVPAAAEPEDDRESVHTAIERSDNFWDSDSTVDFFDEGAVSVPADSTVDFFDEGAVSVPAAAEPEDDRESVHTAIERSDNFWDSDSTVEVIADDAVSFPAAAEPEDDRESVHTAIERSDDFWNSDSSWAYSLLDGSEFRESDVDTGRDDAEDDYLSFGEEEADGRPQHFTMAERVYSDTEDDTDYDDDTCSLHSSDDNAKFNFFRVDDQNVSARVSVSDESSMEYDEVPEDDYVALRSEEESDEEFSDYEPTADWSRKQSYSEFLDLDSDDESQYAWLRYNGPAHQCVLKEETRSEYAWGAEDDDASEVRSVYAWGDEDDVQSVYMWGDNDDTESVYAWEQQEEKMSAARDEFDEFLQSAANVFEEGKKKIQNVFEEGKKLVEKLIAELD